MADPDYSVVLEKIRLALNETGGSRSASDLIAEVRDSIRGTGQPTLRDTILHMENSLATKLDQIRAILAGGPGAPAGGVRVTGSADDARHHAAESRPTLEGNQLEELQRAIATLTETLTHGAEGGGGGRGLTAFDIHAVSDRYKAAVDLVTKGEESVGAAMRDFAKGFSQSAEPLRRQYEAHLNDAALGLINLRTKTTDLIYIFERLGSFVKNQIVEKYSGYLENRSGNLTGSQYFFDEFKRIFDTMMGRRPEVGYGMVNTQEGIKQSLQSGLTSPMVMYGKNIEQLSFMYRQTMEQMQKMGVNARGFGSPEQLQQMIDVLQERSKTLGPFQDMRSQEQLNVQSSSLKYLGDIARYTNLSSEELIKLVKANTQSVAELEAIGILDKRQAENFSNFLPHLQALGPGGQFLGQWLNKFIASGMDQSMFMRNNPEAVQFNAMTRGGFAEALNRFSQIALREGNFESKQAEMTAVARQFEPILTNVTSQAVGSALYKDNPLFAQGAAAIRSLAGNEGRLGAPPERDAVQSIATKIEDLTRQFPIFSSAVAGFLGLVGSFGLHVLEFAAAVRLLGLGGAASGSMMGGALAYGGRVLGGVARFAGPVLGGVGGAVSAAADGSSGAGIAGAGVGGAGGAAMGMALGSMVAPVIGTAVGGVLGGFLGSWLGQRGGEMISPAAQAPAVPPPSGNMAGPEAQAIAGATAETQRGYQDQHLSLLSQLVGGTGEGNAILRQVYGELSRQSSSAGLPAAASVPIGRGLSVSAPAAANPGRADNGTPYAGTGG